MVEKNKTIAVIPAEKSLVEIAREAIRGRLLKKDGLSILLEELDKQAAGQAAALTSSIETATGRKALKSIGAKIGTFSSSILGLSGELKGEKKESFKEAQVQITAIIDSEKKVKDFCKNLRARTIKPAVDWQTHEDARKDGIEDRIQEIKLLGVFDAEKASSGDIENNLNLWSQTEIADSFMEFKAKAQEVHDNTGRVLKLGLEVAKAREAEAKRVAKEKRDEKAKERKERDEKIRKEERDKAHTLHSARVKDLRAYSNILTPGVGLVYIDARIEYLDNHKIEGYGEDSDLALRLKENGLESLKRYRGVEVEHVAALKREAERKAKTDVVQAKTKKLEAYAAANKKGLHEKDRSYLERAIEDIKSIEINADFGDSEQVASVTKKATLEEYSGALEIVKEDEWQAIIKAQKERESAEQHGRRKDFHHKKKIKDEIAAAFVKQGFPESFGGKFVRAYERGQLPECIVINY